MASSSPYELLQGNEPKVISCGVLLFNQENEVLLLKHRQGHWGFPKGHQNPGESYPETALRELYEETGLDAVIIHETDFRTHYYPEPGVLKQVRYYIAQPSGDLALRLQSAEILDGDWFSYASALETLSFTNDCQLLATVYNRYLPLRIQDASFKPASLLANTLRPAPLDLPFAEVMTPSFLVDTRLLEDNLRLLAEIRRETSCKILLAQKAYSLFETYPLIGQYLDGVTSSGIYEAELGYSEMPGKEVHVFSPAYKPVELTRLLEISDHIIFNSFAQWLKYREQIEASREARLSAGKKPVSIGLRINPEFSTGGVDLYDPAAPGSRLGIPRQSFLEGVEHYGLDGIDGLHFHTLCEENSDSLAKTWQAVKDRFDPWLQNMKWINFGGGHHITRDDYDLDLLKDVIRDAQNTYQLEVYLEPGEAVVLNCGWLITEVQDLVQNVVDIAILDTSATCHMPDVLEMPYQPKLFLVESSSSVGSASEAGILLGTDTGENSDENPYLYRLGGTTCLAGDVIGDYAFPRQLMPGDRLILCDMALYTMVKTTTFNGMPLPSIYLFGDDGLRLVKEFSYEDFKNRLG